MIASVKKHRGNNSPITVSPRNRAIRIFGSRLLRRRLLGLAIIISISILISGCAGTTTRLPELPALPGDGELYDDDRYRLAQDHFIIARDYERRGMRDIAERYYEIAHDFLPGEPYIRKILIDGYIRSEAYDKALALYGKNPDIAKLPPDDKRAISLIYLRQGDISRAADALETLGGDMSAEERYSLGLLYETAGRKKKALESYRRYFKGEGASSELGIKMAQFQISERKFKEAESLSVILREAFPENADVVALQGVIKYLARDTVAAITRFREALALDSLNEEALRTLAHISVVGNRYEEAVSYYRRLTAQEGVGAPYRRGLAFLLFHIKEYEESGRLLDTLIEERDGSGTANGGDMPAGIMGYQELRLYRGMVYAKTGKKGKAAEEYNAAVAADSAFEDAWRELCFLHILSKDTDSALAVVDRYEAVFPNSASVWKFRGYALNSGERREEAVAALRKAVALDSADYFAWFELGSTLERLKRIDESADAFRAVLRLRPGDAPASNYLGYMWADADMMLDSAKLLIENALKKEPKNGAYLDSYAWVFYRLGDYEKAHRYMKEAMANHEEDDPVIYEHLGDVLFKLGDYVPAAEAYKRSLDLKSEAADRIKERLAEINKIMKGKGR